MRKIGYDGSAWIVSLLVEQLAVQLKETYTTPTDALGRALVLVSSWAGLISNEVEVDCLPSTLASVHALRVLGEIRIRATIAAWEAASAGALAVLGVSEDLSHVPDGSALHIATGATPYWRPLSSSQDFPSHATTWLTRATSAVNHMPLGQTLLAPFAWEGATANFAIGPLPEVGVDHFVVGRHESGLPFDVTLFSNTWLGYSAARCLKLLMAGSPVGVRCYWTKNSSENSSQLMGDFLALTSYCLERGHEPPVTLAHLREASISELSARFLTWLADSTHAAGTSIHYPLQPLNHHVWVQDCIHGKSHAETLMLFYHWILVAGQGWQCWLTGTRQRTAACQMRQWWSSRAVWFANHPLRVRTSINLTQEERRIRAVRFTISDEDFGKPQCVKALLARALARVPDRAQVSLWLAGEGRLCSLARRLLPSLGVSGDQSGLSPNTVCSPLVGGTVIGLRISTPPTVYTFNMPPTAGKGIMLTSAALTVLTDLTATEVKAEAFRASRLAHKAYPSSTQLNGSHLIANSLRLPQAVDGCGSWLFRAPGWPDTGLIGFVDADDIIPTLLGPKAWDSFVQALFQKNSRLDTNAAESAFVAGITSMGRWASLLGDTPVLVVVFPMASVVTPFLCLGQYKHSKDEMTQASHARGYLAAQFKAWWEGFPAPALSRAENLDSALAALQDIRNRYWPGRSSTLPPPPECAGQLRSGAAAIFTLPAVQLITSRQVAAVSGGPSPRIAYGSKVLSSADLLALVGGHPPFAMTLWHNAGHDRGETIEAFHQLLDDVFAEAYFSDSLQAQGTVEFLLSSAEVVFLSNEALALHTTMRRHYYGRLHHTHGLSNLLGANPTSMHEPCSIAARLVEWPRAAIIFLRDAGARDLHDTTVQLFIYWLDKLASGKSRPQGCVLLVGPLALLHCDPWLSLLAYYRDVAVRIAPCPAFSSAASVWALGHCLQHPSHPRRTLSLGSVPRAAGGPVPRAPITLAQYAETVASILKANRDMAKLQPDQFPADDKLSQAHRVLGMMRSPLASVADLGSVHAKRERILAGVLREPGAAKLERVTGVNITLVARRLSGGARFDKSSFMVKRNRIVGDIVDSISTHFSGSRFPTGVPALAAASSALTHGERMPYSIDDHYFLEFTAILRGVLRVTHEVMPYRVGTPLSYVRSLKPSASNPTAKVSPGPRDVARPDLPAYCHADVYLAWSMLAAATEDEVGLVFEAIKKELKRLEEGKGPGAGRSIRFHTAVMRAFGFLIHSFYNDHLRWVPGAAVRTGPLEQGDHLELRERFLETWVVIAADIRKLDWHLDAPYLVSEMAAKYAEAGMPPSAPPLAEWGNYSPGVRIPRAVVRNATIMARVPVLPANGVPVARWSNDEYSHSKGQGPRGWTPDAHGSDESLMVVSRGYPSLLFHNRCGLADVPWCPGPTAPGPDDAAEPLHPPGERKFSPLCRCSDKHACGVFHPNAKETSEADALFLAELDKQLALRGLNTTRVGSGPPAGYGSATVVAPRHSAQAAPEQKPAMCGRVMAKELGDCGELAPCVPPHGKADLYEEYDAHLCNLRALYEEKHQGGARTSPMEAGMPYEESKLYTELLLAVVVQDPSSVVRFCKMARMSGVSETLSSNSGTTVARTAIDAVRSGLATSEEEYYNGILIWQLTFTHQRGAAVASALALKDSWGPRVRFRLSQGWQDAPSGTIWGELWVRTAQAIRDVLPLFRGIGAYEQSSHCRYLSGIFGGTIGDDVAFLIDGTKASPEALRTFFVDTASKDQWKVNEIEAHKVDYNDLHQFCPSEFDSLQHRYGKTQLALPSWLQSPDNPSGKVSIYCPLRSGADILANVLYDKNLGTTGMSEGEFFTTSLVQSAVQYPHIAWLRTLFQPVLGLLIGAGYRAAPAELHKAWLSGSTHFEECWKKYRAPNWTEEELASGLEPCSAPTLRAFGCELPPDTVAHYRKLLADRTAEYLEERKKERQPFQGNGATRSATVPVCTPCSHGMDHTALGDFGGKMQWHTHVCGALALGLSPEPCVGFVLHKHGVEHESCWQRRYGYGMSLTTHLCPMHAVLHDCGEPQGDPAVWAAVWAPKKP